MVFAPVKFDSKTIGGNGVSNRSKMRPVFPEYVPPTSTDQRIEALRVVAIQSEDVMAMCYEAIYKNRDERGRVIISKSMVDAYNAAVAAWTGVVNKLAEIEAENRRWVAEKALEVEQEALRRKIVVDLTTQYGQHGPQYDLLVGLAASVRARMFTLEGLLTTESRAEYESLSKLFVQTVGQLQKYTETTKSESYSKDLNQVMMVVMNIVGKHLDHDPSALERITREVEQRVIEGDGVVVLPALGDGEENG